MAEVFFNFAGGFLYAFRVNMEIGLYSLFGGVLLGFPLTWLRLKGGWAKKVTEWFITLLRAFPVFVLMFALLNFLSQSAYVTQHFSLNIPKIVLIIALCAYSTAVVSDAALDSWAYWRRADYAHALLLIPTLFRIFTILVMSSSIGAAIGVQDAVSYTLATVEAIPDALTRIWLVLSATIFFVTFFSIIRFTLYKFVQRLTKNTP
jgi:ABC-type dipeptide/oligopeptide/nickel transport system permease subunit